MTMRYECTYVFDYLLNRDPIYGPAMKTVGLADDDPLKVPMPEPAPSPVQWMFVVFPEDVEVTVTYHLNQFLDYLKSIDGLVITAIEMAWDETSISARHQNRDYWMEFRCVRPVPDPEDDEQLQFRCNPGLVGLVRNGQPYTPTEPVGPMGPDFDP